MLFRSEDEIDITRGDIITQVGHSLKLGKCVVADIVWFDEVAMELQLSYVIKRATTTLRGDIERIIYKKDINDFSEHPAHNLHLNDIARCVVKFDRALGMESYNNNRVAGSFIIIDKYTNATLGAGMIVEVMSGVNKADSMFGVNGADSMFGANKADSMFGVNGADSKRTYTPQEIALNAYIRKFYPEWECKEI